MGGSAVGMSTAPEVLVSNHCSLPVIAISVITNLAAGMNKTKLSHQETLENAGLAEKKVLNLIKNFIQEIHFDDTTRDN
jgi:purine nucleoside phosphorylase